MKLLYEKESRSLHYVTDPAKIASLIQNYFLKNALFIKNEETGIIVNPVSIQKPGYVIVNSLSELSGELSVYTVLNKYIEYIGVIEQDLGGSSYLFKITALKVAASDRTQNRIMVDTGKVYVNNMRISKNVINASLFNVPTSVKVHFKQYAAQLKHHADEVNLDVYDRTQEKFDMVRRSGKTLYIADTQNEYFYEKDEKSPFITYTGSIDKDLKSVMEEYRRNKIVSEMIVPVSYSGHDGKPIPLGYIHLVSKSKPIPEEKAIEMNKIAIEMVQKMRDANTKVVSEKQNIDNISKDGLRIRITSEELKSAMLEQRGLSFDVIFKLTAPITISSEVCYILQKENYLLVGVKILGHFSRSGDFERYYNMVTGLS